MSEPITFKDFALFVHAGRLKEAGMALSVLLELPDERALRAAEFFIKKMQSDSKLFARLIQLREEINSDFNSALKTIKECFGLDGIESTKALKVIEESMRGQQS